MSEIGILRQSESETVTHIEEMKKSHDQRRHQCKRYSQERRPKTAAFVRTFVQGPDAVLSKKRIGVAHVPRADLLIAETSLMDLLSHDMLHKSKCNKQNHCDNERDFIQRHNGQF